jgi:SAM-dependent methyltransferase
MSDDQPHHAHGASEGHGHGPSHGEGHFDEAEWSRWAAATEREGELLVGFVTGTAERARALLAVEGPGRILDIGAGPAVAACELARLFPRAEVVAVDSSPGMLERAAQRIEAHGLADRVRTAQADIGEGLRDLGPADLIWASMSLHHVGDEVAALRSLRGLLAPGGLLAIAEMAEPMRVLPEDLGLGRTGLGARLERASGEWFTQMRHNLPGAVESQDVALMLAAAGCSIVDDRVETIRFDPPLTDATRAVAAVVLRRAADHLAARLEPDDLEALDTLLDPASPSSVHHRSDAFLEASRRLVLARS